MLIAVYFVVGVSQKAGRVRGGSVGAGARPWSSESDAAVVPDPADAARDPPAAACRRHSTSVGRTAWEAIAARLRCRQPMSRDSPLGLYSAAL